jgi:hypothetical protein
LPLACRLPHTAALTAKLARDLANCNPVTERIGLRSTGIARPPCRIGMESVQRCVLSGDKMAASEVQTEAPAFKSANSAVNTAIAQRAGRL